MLLLLLLLPSYLSLLEDQVTSVRVAAGAVLGPLSGALGGDWAVERVAPQLTELYNRGSSFNQRLTIVRCFGSLGADDVTIMTALQPLLARALADSTVNVRIIAAKTLAGMGDVVDNGYFQQELRPVLQTLAEDADLDCKFYAVQAMEAF